jgi:hypothetical protein
MIGAGAAPNEYAGPVAEETPAPVPPVGAAGLLLGAVFRGAGMVVAGLLSGTEVPGTEGMPPL